MTRNISARGQVPPITHTVPPQKYHRAVTGQGQQPEPFSSSHLSELGGWRWKSTSCLENQKTVFLFSFFADTDPPMPGPPHCHHCREGMHPHPPSTKDVPAQAMEDALGQVTLFQDKDTKPGSHESSPFSMP